MIDKRMIKKVFTGFAFIAVSFVATIIIRDMLLLRQPENALPAMKVYFNGSAQVPYEHMEMHSYSWRFLFRPYNGVCDNAENWPNIKPAFIPPGAKLNIEFSRKCNNVQVYFSENDVDFIPVTGELHAPSHYGVYTYKIQATWGVQGSVLYYMRIQVPKDY